MTEDTQETPGAIPVNEVQGSTDSDAANASYADVEKIASLLNWKLGGALVTQSDRWGTVLRIDFVMPEMDLSPAINRFVCWHPSREQRQTIVLVGQEVQPLPDRFISRQKTSS